MRGIMIVTETVKYKAMLIHEEAVTLGTAELCLSLCFTVHL